MKVTSIHRYGENRQYLSIQAVSSRGNGWRFCAEADGTVSRGGIFFHDPKRDVPGYECWVSWDRATPIALRDLARLAVAS